MRGFFNKNLFSRNNELIQATVVIKSESDFTRTSPRSEAIVTCSVLEEATIIIPLQGYQSRTYSETVQLKPAESIYDGDSVINETGNNKEQFNRLVNENNQDQLGENNNRNDNRQSIALLIRSLTAHQVKLNHEVRIPMQTFESERKSPVQTEGSNDHLNKQEIFNRVPNLVLEADRKEHKMDDTIIDVDITYQPIDYSNVPSLDSENVPTWSHSYIYSYGDLERASAEQQSFYHKFKVKFLTGKWVDLAGNTNYAFILLFDLLKQFNVHKNIKLLEEQVNSISAYYPKTASYAKRFLIEKMREIEDQEGLSRLEWTVVSHSRPDYQSWDWKNRYVKKLGLSDADAKLLDDVYPSSNNFTNVDFCATEIVKLFISARRALENAYKAKSLDQSEQFACILDLVARKQYNFRHNSQNYQYALANNTPLILSFILKYCENKLRELFEYNKRLTFFQGYHKDVLTAINTHIISHIEEQVDFLLKQVAKPDDVTEIELNSLANTRWKVKFNLSESHYQKVGKEAFLLEVKEIIRLNDKNPSLELIYLEIAKLLVGCDKQLSFEYFLLYTHQNMISGRLVLKSMSKTMVKKLFPTSDLNIRYDSVNASLTKKEINIEDALKEIKDFYLPLRKKIILNTQTIRQVEEEHSETVELLNEYLKEEDLIESTAILLNSIPKSLTEIVSIEKSNCGFYKFNATAQEEALIILFRNSDFKLTAPQIEDFCKSTGSMKGTLINNLNESCYELVDDLLIEQDSEEYKLNKTYYDQIRNI